MKSTGMELEKYVNSRLRSICKDELTATSTKLEKALKPLQLFAPWADVPAWALALIEWIPATDADEAAIYTGERNRRGFPEYGADWLAIGQVDGKMYCIIGQTKDHVLLQTTCLGRFFQVAKLVHAFNLKQGWKSTAISSVLCFSSNTHISKLDLQWLKLSDSDGLTLLKVEGFKSEVADNAELTNTIEMPVDARLPYKKVVTREVQTTDREARLVSRQSMVVTKEMAEKAMPGITRKEYALALAILPDRHEIRKFQFDAVRAIRQSCGVSLIKAPPGAGKSVIMALVMAHSLSSHRFKKLIVFFVAPTIDLCKQFLNKSAKNALRVRLGSEWESKTVCLYSDPDKKTTVPKFGDIKASLHGGAKLFISTEASAQLLVDLVPFVRAAGSSLLIMNDEAHWGTADTGASMELLRCVKGKKNDIGIVCTGTPNNEVLKVADQTAADMSIQEAIALKICRDYRVVLPLITTKDTTVPLDFRKFAKKHALCASIIFVVTQMQYFGSRRCILYAKDKDTAEKIQPLLGKACRLFGVLCTSSIILQDTKNREGCYNTFERKATSETWIVNARTNTKEQKIHLQFLIAVRILDFGIDLPACDSIAVLQPPISRCDIASASLFIQRMGRAMRVEDSLLNAHIFVYTDRDNEWLNEAFAALRKFDPRVDEKLRIRSCNPGRQHSKTTKKMESVALEDIIEKYDIRGSVAEVYDKHMTRLVEVARMVAAGQREPTTGLLVRMPIRKESGILPWRAARRTNGPTRDKLRTALGWTAVQMQKFMQGYPVVKTNNSAFANLDDLSKMKMLLEFGKTHGRKVTYLTKNVNTAGLQMEKIYSQFWQKQRRKSGARSFEKLKLNPEFKAAFEEYDKFPDKKNKEWLERVDKLAEYVQRNGKVPPKAGKKSAVLNKEDERIARFYEGVKNKKQAWGCSYSAAIVHCAIASVKTIVTNDDLQNLLVGALEEHLNSAPKNNKAAAQYKTVDGIVLQATNTAGKFKGVSVAKWSIGSSGGIKYRATIKNGKGKAIQLGFYTTAAEAGLAFAKALKEKLDALPKQLTSAEALEQAKKEGIVFKTYKKTGRFWGVSIDNVNKTSTTARPYKASVYEGGKKVYLGMFATAEEAALVVGRRLKSKQSALPTKMDIEDTSSTSSSTKSIASSSSTYVIKSGKRKAIDQMQRNAFEPSDDDSD